MGLKWEFLPADGLGREGENFFRAYVKSHSDDGAKRKMINDLKFRGCCDSDAHRGAKGENGRGREGCPCPHYVFSYSWLNRDRSRISLRERERQG